MTKKITTFIVIAMALLLSKGVQAQGLGINFGYASETLPTPSPILKITLPQSNLNGFYLGANYNIQLSNVFGISVGLQGRYNTRNYDFTLLEVDSHVKETQILVDLPVLINIGADLSDDTRLSFYIGPVVSYAVNGNSEISNTLTASPTKMEWYAGDDTYKPLNIQASAGVSLTVQHIRFFGGYAMGFSDLDKNEKTKTTTSTMYLGLGYVF